MYFSSNFSHPFHYATIDKKKDKWRKGGWGKGKVPHTPTPAVVLPPIIHRTASWFRKL